MAIRYGVIGDTREECMQALTELCERLNAQPALLPSDTFGNGWLARARAIPPADHTAEPGQQ
ncbi:hypothetical protein [Streptomyces sp. SCL15-4]|uniref:hypothetical protein n=1 Tax=Streptomyces sp. SCL15-4 TaxID=2967221 RepID=UPI0029665906|nr:hypothetical protein [Streptomyces sp. SCL15-4]